ncbi:MAG: hypothetical protein GEV28_23520 [Actinophytocola sp.]|uniref:ferredoxin n=1 Tax=Actinophytocola sp. TaxID=1872138 RepID=UPI00132CAEA6|nr:ferredoxin [Actinophytocola sp.]MPZ83199.1 hypothetical protein [Actinophytocola sp.]
MTTDTRTSAGRPRRLIEIDTDSCVGSAMCGSIARGVFALGDDGKATVVDLEAPADEQIDDTIDRALDEAAASCPVSAISWRPAGEGAHR